MTRVDDEIGPEPRLELALERLRIVVVLDPFEERDARASPSSR